jgi:hypothetical protein
MNIDNLTFGEIKEIVALFGNAHKSTSKHVLHGKIVIAVIPNGFIHFGKLNDIGGGRYVLEGASNLRYWKQRTGGLPEFAKNGPVSDDKIDKIGAAHIESVLFFYEAGNWA